MLQSMSETMPKHIFVFSEGDFVTWVKTRPVVNCALSWGNQTIYSKYVQKSHSGIVVAGHTTIIYIFGQCYTVYINGGTFPYGWFGGTSNLGNLHVQLFIGHQEGRIIPGLGSKFRTSLDVRLVFSPFIWTRRIHCQAREYSSTTSLMSPEEMIAKITSALLSLWVCWSTATTRLPRALWEVIGISPQVKREAQKSGWV